MKTKIIIKKNGITQDQPYLFDDQVTLDNFLEMIKVNQTFGKTEHQEIDTPESFIEHPEVPAVLDVNGVEISPVIPAYTDRVPATYKTIPSEYTVEQINITAEYEAEQLKLQYLPISPRQIRLALLALGVTDALVELQINSLPSPDKEAAMIAWKYSTEFQRFIPMVESIGLMLGLDANGLNLLWASAIKL